MGDIEEAISTENLKMLTKIEITAEEKNKQREIDELMQENNRLDYMMAETIWWFQSTPERRSQFNAMIERHKKKVDVPMGLPQNHENGDIKSIY
jgi:hypothetical protein